MNDDEVFRVFGDLTVVDVDDEERMVSRVLWGSSVSRVR